MAYCLLALGSNLGDRHSNLARACSELSDLADCRLLARSSWHGTVPIGGADGQGQFLNGAALLETSLPAQTLARSLHAIETKLGRERIVRWDARTLDIDVLLYGDTVMETDDLTIPHPRMAFRNFVLEPAVEIAGGLLHPTTGWTLSGLLAHLRNSPRFVLVTASQPHLAKWLEAQLIRSLKCESVSLCEKKAAPAGVLQPDRGIKFRADACGIPPAIAAASPEKIVEIVGGCSQTRPALIVSLDVVDAKPLAELATSTGLDQQTTGCVRDTTILRQPGIGPIAKISSNQPETVIQEAEAAIRCIWPDVQ